MRSKITGMSPPTSPALQENLCASTDIPLGYLFRQVRDLLRQNVETELANAGLSLTFSQYITLRKLNAGVSTISELAAAAELHPGAMTRLLDKLEDKALIERVADSNDRRTIHIHLTTEGKALCPVIERASNNVLNRALHGMSRKERDLLQEMLLRVKQNLV